MYLKSLKIENFRKFGEIDNIVEFVTPYTERSFIDNFDRTSIANATTLVVGKNNAGKTTITAALSQAILSEKISGSKFNYKHLKDVFDSYFIAHTSELNIKTPEMGFVFHIGLDAAPEIFSINNLSYFIKVDDLVKDNETVTINIRYEVEEVSVYESLIKNHIISWTSRSLNEKEMFREFLKVITNEVQFVRKIYDIENEEVSPAKFRLNDLIDIKIIKAHLDDHSRNLSSVFNKIVKYKLNTPEQKDDKNKIIDHLFDINKTITHMVGNRHNQIVNDIVGKVTDKRNMEVHLQANLDYDEIFNKVIDYEFKENDNYIPEDQFGLGYTNLMKIIGQLIDYIEQYEGGDSFGKVNIICVEEPENYMHPQMQELFIHNIDSVLKELLNKTQKKINSQIILTTHSPHIINSKIHTSGTFDNLNYILTSNDKCTKVVCLRDANIANINKEKNSQKISKEELAFLKTHIKFKVSDLFFSDAVILVEGVTEEQLLQYYISEDRHLKKSCISIFNINGAFAHVYKALLEVLGIPCLAITDLDIKRKTSEKESFLQINSLKNKKTTNAVIKKFICEMEDEDEDEDDYSSVSIPDVLSYYTDESNGGFKIVYQKNQIQGYFASSFEEAFILTNYNNIILNKTLMTIKPRVYTSIVGKKKMRKFKNSVIYSYKWQRKLSSNKSEFANTLLYYMLSTSYSKPKLPDYINDGLQWLRKKL